MGLSIENPSADNPGDNQRYGATAADGQRWFILKKILLTLLVILLLPVSSSLAQNLTCRRLPVLLGTYLTNHYAMKDMTGQIQANAVDQMIKNLDPAKTLLYESDVTSLKGSLQDLFTDMQSGNCVSLRQVYDLLVTRAKENEAQVKEILTDNYRLDETLELIVDVNKRPYARNREDKRSVLTRVMQFQMENDLLMGISLPEAKKRQIHRYELQTKRVIERDPDRLIVSFAEAFALALDPHTSYLSPENYADLRIQMQLSLEGIGAVLSSDNGFTIIEELMPGGGAERSGRLSPKDKIISVRQAGEAPVNVIDMNLRDVIKMIRGKKGTQVTLTILRQGTRATRFDVTIIRDKIDIKEQEAKITYETKEANGKSYRFGVIDLPSFYGDDRGGKSCYQDVKKLLAEARRERVDGIVLDLSRNSGGLLGEAVRLAGLFLGRGPIVAVRDSRGQVTILANGAISSPKAKSHDVMEFPAENNRQVYTGPLVVLTSRLSASASEIVAGALQDYQRAVIIGSDRTFGKGSVQTLTPLPLDLGAMKVTTALYFLPGGKSTQKVGVNADVRVPLWFALEEVGEAELDYPLPAQQIANFLDQTANRGSLWKPVPSVLLQKLAQRSAARVAKDPRFIKIIKDNEEAAAKKGIIRIGDLRKEIEKEGNNKKETQAEIRKKAREQSVPFVRESVNVLLDAVLEEKEDRRLKAEG